MNWKCQNCHTEIEVKDGNAISFCPNCGKQQIMADSPVSDESASPAESGAEKTSSPQAPSSLLTLDHGALRKAYRESLYLHQFGMLVYVAVTLAIGVSLLRFAIAMKQEANLKTGLLMVLLVFVWMILCSWGYVLRNVRTTFSKWLIRINTCAAMALSIAVIFFDFSVAKEIGTGLAFLLLLFGFKASFCTVLFNKPAPTHRQIKYLWKKLGPVERMPEFRKPRYFDRIAEICAILIILFHAFALMGVLLSTNVILSVANTKRAAKQGNTQAQIQLANMYFAGLGVEVNFAEGVKWFRRAADAGDVEAYSDLADLYLMGLGVERNVGEARKWLQKAAAKNDSSAKGRLICMNMLPTQAKAFIDLNRKRAEEGNVEAQVLLGDAYRDGIFGKQDLPESIKWLLKAAEGGDMKGQHVLAWMYLWGLGVERNPAEAKKWFQKSAKQGDSIGKDILKYL